MSSLANRIADRLRRLTTTQLRLIYSLIALFAFLWVGLVILIHFISIPVHTDETQWESVSRGNHVVLVVDSVTPGGGADRAGVLAGDTIIALNGVRLDTHRFSWMIESKATEAMDLAPIDVPIPLHIKRGDQEFLLSIQLKEIDLSISQRLMRFLMPAVTLIWLLVGVMVILSQPHGTVQRRFFLTAATSVVALMAGTFFGTSTGSLGMSQGLATALDTVQVIVAPFFFVFWLRFSASFPVERPVFTTQWRKFLLWLPVTLTMILLLFSLIIPENEISEARKDTGWVVVMIFQSLLGLTWVVYFFAGIWLLYRGYRKLPEGIDRRPMRIIVAGALLTAFVPFYLLLIAGGVLLIGESGKPSQLLILPVLLVAALPISFGYAIIRYQLMDFRRIVSTTAVYVLTMGLIVAAYLGLGYAVSQMFGSLSGRLGETLGIVGFVLFLLLFDPLKRQLQTTIEQRFFPQRRDYSTQIVEFSDQTSQMVTAEEVTSQIATVLFRTLDLSDVCVVLWDGSDQPVTAARSCRQEAPPDVDQEALAALRQHLHDDRQLLALETFSTPVLEPLQAIFPYAIGLYTRDTVRGAILLGAPTDGSTPNSRQMQFIGAIATQGGSALEIVDLMEKEIARQRYQEELATARRIQQSILPTALPSLEELSVSAISHPAEAVGGDYYNVIALDEEHLLVIVADVSGKGLPASFYMAELHGMICIASATCATASEMLRIINDHLYRQMPRGTFITATALLVDTRQHRISLARAGHTPLIVRNGSGTVTLSPPGPALGFVRGQQFTSMLREQQIEYTPGDTFILYSDGVSEMMNERHEEFTDERLLALIDRLDVSCADAVRDAIVQAVDDFRGGAEQNDDVTVVVVQSMAEDSSVAQHSTEQFEVA